MQTKCESCWNPKGHPSETVQVHQPLDMAGNHKRLSWLIGIAFGLLVLALVLVKRSDNKKDDAHKRRQLTAILRRNTLSYVYIVGVEGVGHHGVSPAIATIARTCNKHVLYEMKQLRADQQRRSIRGVKAQLTKFGSTHYSSTDVVIIEDGSFPTGGNNRNSTLQHIKGSGHYDLEWRHNELLKNVPTMKIKYLYLNRDFYRAVASHPEFDGTFERHADVLHTFMMHIESEYRILDGNSTDSWRQINYEWFTNMDIYNCTAIVSAVVDFMEWDNCDVEFACQSLNETLRKETKKEIIPEDYAYAQTFNVTLPIPLLDISPNRTYNFTTVVSERVPIKIISDIGPRRIKRTRHMNMTRTNSTGGFNRTRSTIRFRVGINTSEIAEYDEPAEMNDIVRNHVRNAINRRAPRNFSRPVSGAPWTHHTDTHLPGEAGSNSNNNHMSPSGLLQPSSSASSGGSLNVPGRRGVANEVSILFLVGLQGSQQAVVSKALAFIAKSANYHIVYMHPFLSRAHKKLLSMQYKSTLSAFKNSNFVSTTKVLVLFNEAFPLTEELPEPPGGDKYRRGAYNLMWVVTQANELGFAIKFLYLQRDFQHTVASVPALLRAQPVEKQVEVLTEYALHIQQEYQRIESKKAGLWALIKYEWFVEAASGTGTGTGTGTDRISCADLVAVITHYAGWDGPNTVTVCEHLRTMAFSVPPAATIAEAESAAVHGAAAQLNLSIPVLDLSTEAVAIATAHLLLSSQKHHQHHGPQQVNVKPPVPPRPPRPPRPVPVKVNPGTPPLPVSPQLLEALPQFQSQSELSTLHPTDAVAATPPQRGATNSLSKSKGAMVPTAAPTSRFNNQVSMLYLVGLPGANTGAVAGALAGFAQAAKYRVIEQHPHLVRAQKAMLPMLYKSTLSAFRNANFITTDKVLVLFHSDFPTTTTTTESTASAGEGAGGVTETGAGAETETGAVGAGGENVTTAPPEERRRNGLNNLLWVWTQAREVGVNVKFLFLQRDLREVVVSVSAPLLALPVEKRVDVLRESTQYVLEEYQRIENKQAGLWAQLKYEWFTQAATSNRTDTIAAGTAGAEASAESVSAMNCASLVTAVTQHVGWEGCDTEQACLGFKPGDFAPPILSLSLQEEEVVMAANVTLPINMLKVSS